MRYGVALGRLNPHYWPEITFLAEELGFAFISIPEHLVLPVHMSGSPTGSDHPPIDPALPVFDVWVYIAFLAARTTRIRFGTYVYNVGLRHPFITARAVATADILSGGRVDLGVGASWLAEEWSVLGLDFRTRGARLEETLQICQRLWREREVEHHGDFFDFDPVMFEPKPIQQPIPLLFGGDAMATRRRAIEFGGGWVPLRTPDRELGAAVATFRTQWCEAGRPADDLRIVRASHHANADDIEAMADIGVTDVVVAPWGRSPAASAALREFADRQLSSPEPAR